MHGRNLSSADVDVPGVDDPVVDLVGEQEEPVPVSDSGDGVERAS